MDYDSLIGEVKEIIDEVELEIERPCIGRTRSYFFTKENTIRIEISWTVEEGKKKRKIYVTELYGKIFNPKSVDEFNKFIQIAWRLKNLLPEKEQGNFVMAPECFEKSCKCTINMRFEVY